VNPTNDIAKRLAEPFPDASIGMKPQSVKGNRALVVFYIDARDVMDRFDTVVGMGNWQDDYELLPDGSVVCRLQIRVEDRWITKTDVGSPSEQPDGGDRLKAAFSDALKRAAVKYGIGRYLYSMPNLWADYDPAKRCFSNIPEIIRQIPKEFRFAVEKQQSQLPKAQDAAPAAPAAKAGGEATADGVWALIQKLASMRNMNPNDLFAQVMRFNKLTYQTVDSLPAASLVTIAGQLVERIQHEGTK
jgi:hypothetical protein